MKQKNLGFISELKFSKVLIIIITRRWRRHQVVVIVRIVFHRIVGALTSAESRLHRVEHVLVGVAQHSSLPTFRLFAFQSLSFERDHAAFGQHDVVDDVICV